MLMLYGELKHYYFNYIFYNLGMIIFFIGLIKNFNFKEHIILQIVSLITWHIITSSLSYLCDVVQDEAVMGTLEHLFLTKTGILKIFLSKVVVNILFTLFKSILMFIICMLVFSKQVSIPITVSFVSVTVLIEIIMATAGYSFGLVLGGIAFYFKRISSFVQVITNLLLFFSGILINIDRGNILYYILPIPSGMNIIKGAIFGNLQGHDVIIFLMITIVYILCSLLFFKKLLNRTKMDGVLGNY